MGRLTVSPVYCADGAGARVKALQAGESEAAAIKRYMASRKRAWRSPDPLRFPQWKPGMSTAAYIGDYFHLNYSTASDRFTVDLFDIKGLSRPAPYCADGSANEQQLAMTA